MPNTPGISEELQTRLSDIVGKDLTLRQVEKIVELFGKDDRIDKAIELLEDYEQWEADLISDNSMWWPYRDKDAVYGKTYDKMLVLQEKRNKVLQSLNQ